LGSTKFLEESESALVNNTLSFYETKEEVVYCPEFGGDYKPKFAFDHITNIGKSPSLAFKPPTSEFMTRDWIWEKFIQANKEYGEVEKMAKHCAAVSDVDRYIASLRKCDKPMKKPTDFKMDIAVKYTIDMLKPFLYGKGSKTTVKFNPHTSVGSPFSRVTNPDTGKFFQTKGELFSSTLFPKLLRSLHTPLSQVLDKHEYLPQDEVIDEHKLRTYFNTEAPFVMKQKLMFDAQDEAMKLACNQWQRQWSRYGFCKQYGGIDSLVRAHQMLGLRRRLEKVFHKQSDVSGWDRVIPLMDEVYQVRKALFGPMSEIELEHFEYIKQNVCHPVCVLFNGELIQRHTGNISGSGKTSTDNTIAHIICEMYTLITMYYDKNGTIPTLEFILTNTVISLYGDDDLSSYIISDWMDGTEEDFIRRYKEIYLEFGLVIKDKAFKGQFDDLVGLEFLGNTIYYNKAQQLYFGEPRWSKILTSIIYNLESKDRSPQQYCSIVEAASALAFGIDNEVGTLVNKMLCDYARFLLDHDNIRQNLAISNINFLSSVASGLMPQFYLMTGYESSFFRSNTNFFFTENQCKQREVVGFKGDMQKTNRNFNRVGVVTDQNKTQLNSDAKAYTPEMREYVPSVEINKKFNIQVNYIGLLQELTVNKGFVSPNYDFCRVGGSDHVPVWRSLCTIDGGAGSRWFTSATDNNKQNAKNISAFYAVDYYTQLARVAKLVDDVDSVVISKPNKDLVDRQQKFFFELMVCIRSYCMCSDEEKPFHTFSPFLDNSDREAAARLAVMFKEGSFNPYGNGQTTSLTQIQLFEPRIEANMTGWSCVSTIMVDKVPTGVFGSGATQMAAFENWTDQIILKLSIWSPQQMVPFFEKIKTLPEPPEGHPLRYLWSKADPRKEFVNEFKEGSFNPYGNGMGDDSCSHESEESSEDELISTSNILGEIHEEQEMIKQADKFILEHNIQQLKHIKGCSFEAFNQIAQLIDTKFPPTSSPQEMLQQIKLMKHISHLLPPVFFNEGGFNPYGNGQTSVMNQEAYYKSLPANLSKAERRTKYEKYLAKHSKNQTLSKALRNNPSDVKKSLDSQIGSRKKVIKGKSEAPKARENKTISKGGRVKEVFKLSECAQAYATCLTCPFYWEDKSCAEKVKGFRFDPSTLLPCIPLLPNLDSKKTYAFCRGTIGVNAGGFFQIMYRPRWLANDFGVLNSNASVYGTTTTTAIADTFMVADTGAGILANTILLSVNSEFSMADLVVNAAFSGVSYRVVGGGYRYRYTGPVVGTSGICYNVTEPDHFSLSAMAPADYSGLETYFKTIVSTEWTSLYYSPVMMDEFNYFPDWHANVGVRAFIPGSSFNACMGTIGVGLPTGLYIDFEAITFYEVIGKNVRDKTKTPADPVGASQVLNSVNPDMQKTINEPEATVKSLVNAGGDHQSSNSLVPEKDVVGNVMGSILNVAKFM